MRRLAGVDWWIAVVGPLGCLLMALPLFAALNHVSARVQPSVRSTSAWLDAQRQADEALADRRLGDAVRRWHQAYTEALSTGQWRAMVEVGDLALRVGEATGSRTTARMRARECYASALARARRDRALEGVLRVAESFARLGDLEVVDQTLDVAAAIAERRSPDAREAYRATAERLRIRPLTATGIAR